jgi:hypothetical protein
MNLFEPFAAIVIHTLIMSDKHKSTGTDHLPNDAGTGMSRLASV